MIMKTYPLDINELYIPIMYNAKRISSIYENGECIDTYKDPKVGIIEVVQIKGHIKYIYYKDTNETFINGA